MVCPNLHLFSFHKIHILLIGTNTKLWTLVPVGEWTLLFTGSYCAMPLISFTHFLFLTYFFYTWQVVVKCVADPLTLSRCHLHEVLNLDWVGITSVWVRPVLLLLHCEHSAVKLKCLSIKLLDSHTLFYGSENHFPQLLVIPLPHFSLACSFVETKIHIIPHYLQPGLPWPSPFYTSLPSTSYHYILPEPSSQTTWTCTKYNNH